MPEVKKEGPKSAEDGETKSVQDMVARLRIGRTWRHNITALLQEEYLRFAWVMTAGGTFGVQTTWEYYWLAYTTNQYLRSNPEPVLAAWFYDKATSDLEGFNRQIVRLMFDVREKGSMQDAMDRTRSLMKKWKAVAEEVRE